MRQSAAWVLQAKSDLAAAKAVLQDNEASTYCQALAKCQQVTEKSIKGMIAALNELGISDATVSGGHSLAHELNGLDAIRRKKPDLDDVSVGMIDRMLRKHKQDILWLCSLAPGGLRDKVYPRNTEYPFGDPSLNDWSAPADETTFSLAEVARARTVAWPLHQVADRFASSLRRRRR